MVEQQSVYNCLEAAKRSGTSIRYVNYWLFECIMFCIKSRQTYLHVQTHDILPIPKIRSLHNHLDRIKPVYGFKVKKFNLLRLKAVHLPIKERRGLFKQKQLYLTIKIMFDCDKCSLQNYMN